MSNEKKFQDVFDTLMSDDGKIMVRLHQLKDMLDTQGEDGNWNYSPYMLGIYNGMAMAIAILEDIAPVFREAPEVWLEDIGIDEIPSIKH